MFWWYASKAVGAGASHSTSWLIMSRLIPYLAIQGRYFLFFLRPELFKNYTYAGADLGIYRRWGGGFGLSTFFLGRPNWFCELSETSIKTQTWPNFLRRRQIFEKGQIKAFLGSFRKTLTKKLRFFGARSPSELVWIGAKGVFRKILRSVSQKWISENSTKGGPFRLTGGGIPEGKKRPPPPKSARTFCFKNGYSIRQARILVKKIEREWLDQAKDTLI